MTPKDKCKNCEKYGKDMCLSHALEHALANACCSKCAKIVRPDGKHKMIVCGNPACECHIKLCHADKGEALPCPHGRLPIDGVDGWKHCPHCLGINRPAQEEKCNLCQFEKGHSLECPKYVRKDFPTPAKNDWKERLADISEKFCPDKESEHERKGCLYWELEPLIATQLDEYGEKEYNRGYNDGKTLIQKGRDSLE